MIEGDRRNKSVHRLTVLCRGCDNMIEIQTDSQTHTMEKMHELVDQAIDDMADAVTIEFAK